MDNEYIVSLGEDCLVGLQLEKLGYRKCAYPFDWLGYEGDCYLKSAVDLMCNNFSSFLIFNNLQDRGPSGVDDCRLIYDPTICFRMKHDFPINMTVKDAYSLVKEKYDRRINRLLSILNSDSSVCFIHMNYKNILTDEVITEQCTRLQQNFPLCKMRFLILRNNPTYQRFEVSKENLAPNILVIDLNNTEESNLVPDNHWWRNEHVYVKIIADYINQVRKKEDIIDMKNIQPKVSIIVPVYKTAKYLRKCFDSILNQTFKDIEVIIVSDGPQEDDLICEEYTQKYPNIRLLRNVNKGLGGARNAGIDLAKGEYIAFVDSDDWIEPSYIQKMYDAMVSDESIDIVQCGTNIVFEKEINPTLLDSDNNYFAIREEGKIPVTDDIYGKINVGSWNKLYKKSLISKFKIRFPENLRNEDAYFTWAYWSVCQNMYCIADKLYNYLRRDDSLMAKTFKKGMKAEVLDHLIVGKLFYKFLKQNNLLEKRKIAFLKAYNISYWFSRDNGDWLRKQHAFFKAHKFLKNIDIPSNFEELKIIKKTSLLKFIRKKFLFLKRDNKHNIYQIFGIKIKFKRKNNQKKQLLNVKKIDKIQEILPKKQNLYYNIEGENNKILIIENGIERELRYDEKIDGLDIKITGNNNVIKIFFPCLFKNASFVIESNTSQIIIHKSPRFMWFIKMINGEHQFFEMGEGSDTSWYGQVHILDGNGSGVKIGKDCMFAGDIIIFASDGHAVFNTKTSKVINIPKSKVEIGNHCWIGQGAKFTKGAQIPKNCIIAGSAVVTKKFEKTNVIIGGNPAKILKEDVDWDRCSPDNYQFRQML